jgi:hypothetical protein
MDRPTIPDQIEDRPGDAHCAQSFDARLGGEAGHDLISVS